MYSVDHAHGRPVYDNGWQRGIQLGQHPDVIGIFTDGSERGLGNDLGDWNQYGRQW